MDSDSEDSDEYYEITDSEEEDPIQASTSALETLIASSQERGAFDRAFAYQRRPEPTERTLFNRSRRERELRKAAENTPKLHTFFPTASGRPAMPSSPSPILSTVERKQQSRFAAITALEKKLASKKECEAMNGQTLMRHQVVLAFLRVQANQSVAEPKTRESFAAMVALCHGKGPSFARRIITWEIEWMEERSKKGKGVAMRRHNHGLRMTVSSRPLGTGWEHVQGKVSST